MTVYAIGSMNNRFVGLSTDTKPTGVNSGATFFESNTGYMFINNGEAWVPKSYMPETTVNFKSVDIATNGAKNVMTATAQNLFIDAVVVHVPDDLSAVAGLTSMAVYDRIDRCHGTSGAISRELVDIEAATLQPDPVGEEKRVRRRDQQS